MRRHAVRRGSSACRVARGRPCQSPAPLDCCRRATARTRARARRCPPAAQVGVGAFVLNERREVLVVQEKMGPLRGKGVWKLPTGLGEP